MANPRPMPTIQPDPSGKNPPNTRFPGRPDYTGPSGSNPRPMPTIQPAPPGKDPRNPMGPGGRLRGPSMRLPMPSSGETIEAPSSQPSSLRELIMFQAPAEKQDAFADFRRRQMLSDQDPMLDAMMRRMR